MNMVLATILLCLSFAPLVQAESKPLDGELKRKIATELVTALNEKDNSIRAKLLDFYKSCDDQWMGCRSSGRQLEESGADGFTFNLADVVRSKITNIVYLSSSYEDICPKATCNPSASGTDQYLILWQENQASKWSSGLNEIFMISATIAYQTRTVAKGSDGIEKSKSVEQGKFRFEIMQNSLK